jgi:hypothetical protein
VDATIRTISHQVEAPSQMAQPSTRPGAEVAFAERFVAEAVSARQAAVELREAADDQEQVGEGLRWLSRLHWWAGRRNEAEAALAWASRAKALAERLGDQETLTHALTNIGTARLSSSDLGGRAELEQAFEVAVAAGLDDHAARALVNLAGSTVEMRDYRRRQGVRTGRAGPPSVVRRGAGLLVVAGRCAAGGSGGRRRTVPAADNRRLAGGRRRLAGARLPI